MYKFYCLSYNNPGKKKEMIDRFEKLQVPYFISTGVGEDHPFSKRNGYNPCMVGHLKNIEEFYNDNTVTHYGIFCEDDIYIDKNIKAKLPIIFNEFELQELDILLLGYLYNETPEDQYIKKASKLSGSNYYNYSNDTWGTQMFMLSKKQAKYLLDKYYYTDEIPGIVYSPDWTLTKDPVSGLEHRSLLFPMLAVENGKTGRGMTNVKDFIVNFHIETFLHNYDLERLC